MTDQSWRKVFVGREEELKLLHDAWGKAKGGEPQFVTFLAETGVGKTRLVQHFYSCLTREEDPDHYWPDSMDSAAASLAINPSFPEDWKQDNIPWLWWGLRASDRTGRNWAESFGCAIQDGECKIEPHAISILFNRQKKTLTKDMYFELIKLGCDSFADWVTLGVVSKLYDVSQLVLKYKEERKRQKQEHLTIHQITEQKKADLSEKAVDYLSTVLNKKDKDAPTVPVILVLDDAQWFDKTSLIFVELLWQAASKNGWPLLIVATHWQREWLQNEAEITESKTVVTSFDQPPANLVHLIRRNSRLFENWNPVQLPILQANILQPVLTNAFPGITTKQQQMLLHRVGGNPQYLDDLIRWMQENPRRFFENKDCQKPLTESGEKKVNGQLKKGHMALVRKRFDALEEDMRNLLGFGSYQGMSFVEPLIVDVVSQLYDGDNTDWQGHFGHAMHPYAVINRISKVTDEFTQRNVYEVANEHLHEIDKEAFSKLLLSVLIQWYESGKISTQPISEREALLTLLCREIHDLFEHADLLVRVQMDLVELYDDSNRPSDAAEVALIMEDQIPEGGWRLETLSFSEQNRLGTTLLKFSHHREAQRVYNNLILQMQGEILQNTAWKNDLAAAHMNRGNLHQRQNHAHESLTDYKAAIDILQQLRDEMREQFLPAWKKYLATAHMNRGNLLSDNPNHARESLNDYKAAIDILQQLRDEMGEQFPSAWKSSLAAAHVNRGVLLSDDPNQTHESLTDYKAAIDILQQLCDEMGEQFLPAWKNDLAAAHINRGNLHQRQNHAHDSLNDYKAAIDIRQQLRNEMGEQFPPAWKNSLAMCYYNFALFLESSDKEKACSLFSQAFQLATSLHNEFGDGMPESWMQLLTASEEACKRCGV